MTTTTEKIYKRVRQLWNDEYELNPGHRIIQSVQMVSDDKIEVELGDFRFYFSVENNQLSASTGLIPDVEAPSEEEMNKVITHVADLLKNQIGDLPLTLTSL